MAVWPVFVHLHPHSFKLTYSRYVFFLFLFFWISPETDRSRGKFEKLSSFMFWALTDPETQITVDYFKIPQMQHLCAELKQAQNRESEKGLPAASSCNYWELCHQLPSFFVIHSCHTGIPDITNCGVSFQRTAVTFCRAQGRGTEARTWMGGENGTWPNCMIWTENQSLCSPGGGGGNHHNRAILEDMFYIDSHN